MARRSGVTSKLSMTALVCPACGAPLSESDTTKCDHCGADLAAGERSWVLDGVMQPEQMTFRLHAGAPAAAASDGTFTPALPDVADPRERRVLFARMAQLMASDGSIDRRERKLLEMCATRWGIPGEQVQQILAGSRSTRKRQRGSSRGSWPPPLPTGSSTLASARCSSVRATRSNCRAARSTGRWPRRHRGQLDERAERARSQPN
jgi:hypothetical protein